MEVTPNSPCCSANSLAICQTKKGHLNQLNLLFKSLFGIMSKIQLKEIGKALS